MVGHFPEHSSIFKFVLMPSDFSAEGFINEAKEYTKLSQIDGENKAERKKKQQKLLEFLSNFVEDNEHKISGKLRRKIQYWRWTIRVTPVFEGSKELHAVRERKKEALYRKKRDEEIVLNVHRRFFAQSVLVFGTPALILTLISVWMVIQNHMQLSQVPMPEVVLYYRYWFFLGVAALFGLLILFNMRWYKQVREWTYYMFIYNKTDLGRLIFVVPMVLVCLSPFWVLYIDYDFYTRKRFYNKTYDFAGKGYQRCAAFDLGGWGIESDYHVRNKKTTYLIPYFRYGYVKKEHSGKYDCNEGA